MGKTMWTRLGAVTGLVVAGVVLMGSPAAAGGWAMSSLDAMPEPVAGEQVAVGFTIRQHGVTPVNPDADGGEPVAVVVRSASGGEKVFAARQVGPTGHYVADVTFPEPGPASWAIRQGWFGPHDLGVVDVAPSGGGSPAVAAAPAGATGAGDAAGSADPAGADYRWPLAARVVAIAVAAAAGGVALADVRRGRSGRSGSAEAVPL